MARNSKSIMEQIAETAEQDQAILTITVGGKAWRLPVMGKMKVAGDVAFMDIPAVYGLFQHQDGNLSKATATQIATSEELFFPQRAEELRKLQELAKKFGFSLTRQEGSEVTPTRTRAPKGKGKPKAEPRAVPSKGQLFLYEKTKTLLEVADVIEEDGKSILIMADQKGDTRKVPYSAVFWRYYKEQSTSEKNVPAVPIKEYRVKLTPDN